MLKTLNLGLYEYELVSTAAAVLSHFDKISVHIWFYCIFHLSMSLTSLPTIFIRISQKYFCTGQVLGLVNSDTPIVYKPQVFY